MCRIIVVLLSEIDDRLIKAVAHALEQTFGVAVRTRKLMRPLDPAFDSSRQQFSSPRLLARLRRIKKDPDDKVLGITDVDIYSPGYDFVFGEAETASGVATLSLYRLQPEHYRTPRDEELFEQRAIKEAIHEVGHLYSLGHCRRRGCVMRACTSITHVDRKRGSFCAVCRAGLKG
jgi:archaemetzincin